MIIYSVTVGIDLTVEQDWLQWMRAVHIPDVMATGYFTSWHMARLIDPPSEGGIATYNIQYQCESMERYEAYQQNAAPALQEDHTQRYKDRFVAFRTILERV